MRVRAAVVEKKSGPLILQELDPDELAWTRCSKSCHHRLSPPASVKPTATFAISGLSGAVAPGPWP
jgi:hypothetical protein